MSAVTTSQGRVTCKYDTFGRVASVQQSDGSTARFEYNNLDLPTLVEKSNGTAEKLRYDEHGRLVRDERSATEWEECTYDRAGRIETARSAPAQERHLFYDDAGRVARVKFSSGKEVSYAYTADGLLAREAWSTGETTEWRYDAQGQLVELTNPAGLRTRYTYDNKGRMITCEDPVHGRKVFYPLSPYRTDADTPALGKSSERVSAWGKPFTRTDPGGETTWFRYNAAGTLQSIVAPSGVAWRYEFDETHEVSGITAPSGLKTSVTRGALGRVEKITRGPVAWREYRYDPTTRSQQAISPLGTAETLKLDAEGRRSEVDLPSGKVSYAYDPNGRHATIKSADYQLEEEYHDDGTLARRSYNPAGMEVRLPRDAQGRLAGVELNGLKSVHAYDARGQVERIDLPGGTAIKIARDAAGRPAELTLGTAGVTKISYDAADRILAVETTKPDGKAIFSEHYTYDAAGNIGSVATDGAPAATFQYDRMNQLKKITVGTDVRTLEFDPDNNVSRITRGGQVQRWVLDKMGRPVQLDARKFTWDAAGNLVRSETAFSKTLNVFDAADRLVRHTEGKNEWSYGYLPDGDRLWRQSAAGKRWFAYLPDRLVGYTEEHGIQWLVVSLPGTDRPLALCGSNGVIYYALTDRIGSLRRLVDPKGAVLSKMDYSPFGNPEGPNVAHRFRMFAGMVGDESELFYARQRYYDSKIVRFISIDPLIGTPGVPTSHNAYAYAGNNPLRFRDPLGADFSSEITHEDNAVYHILQPAEKAAVREAYEGVQQAQRVLQNAASSARDIQTASVHLKDCEAVLAQLNQRGRVRLKAYVMNGPTEELSAVGKANAARNLAEAERAVAALDGEVVPRAGAARYLDAGAANTTGKIVVKTGEDTAAAGNAAARTGAVKTGEAAAANSTQPVAKAATSGAAASSATDVASLQAKVDKALANNEALELTKAEVEALKAAGSTVGAAGVSAERMAQIEAALANGDALILSKAEMAALKAQSQAGADAAAKAGTDAAAKAGTDAAAKAGTDAAAQTAGTAGGKAAGEAATRGAEEAAEGIGSRLLRGAGGMMKAVGPWLQALGAAADIELIGQVDYNATKMYGAEGDALKAKQLGNAIKDKLDEEIRRIAKEEPGRLQPMPDGRMPDPNNPDDIEQVIIGMHLNLWKHKDPFAGLIKPKEFPPDAAKDPTKPKDGENGPLDAGALAAALDKARALLDTGYTAEKAARNASAEMTKQEAEAQSQLQSAVTIAGARAMGDNGVSQVLVAADDVKKQTAAVRTQTQALQAAMDSMNAAAVRCEAAATKVCGLAGQAATATPDQIKSMRADATTELGTASDQLNAAQAKIDSATVAVSDLRTSLGVLDGFRANLTLYKMGSGIANGAGATPEGALAAAKTAAAAASAARDKLTPQIEQMQAIPPQVEQILAPFAGNPSAAVVVSAAANIGKGIEAPGLFDFPSLLAVAMPVIDAALAAQKSVEQAIANVDIEALYSVGNSALAAAEDLRTKAIALGTGPERYQALQRASNCFGQIKTAGEPVTTKTDPSDTPADGTGKTAATDPTTPATPAPATPSGSPATPGPTTASTASTPASSPKPGDTAQGTMPNLVGLTLEQASTRLKGKMRIGGDEIGNKPPSPEKALTIFFQTPAAGSKLATDKETVVTVKRYGSAKEAAPPPPPPPTGDAFDQLMDAIEKKYTSYYLQGGIDNAKKNGIKETSDLEFSIRHRTDGNVDYFFNNRACKVVSGSGANLHLVCPAEKDAELAPLEVEIHDDLVRVTHVIIYSDPSHPRKDGSYFYREKETETLPRTSKKFGFANESLNPENPEEAKQMEKVFGK